MNKTRMEAFSDGVVAILITIMILELHPPAGSDWAALQPIIPSALASVPPQGNRISGSICIRNPACVFSAVAR